MASTIKDVARAAGVSTATVSRVVNNDPRIAPATRQRVASAIQALGYTVNTVARSLKSKRTLTVGFVTPEIANDFFMNVAQGAEDALRDAGYAMIIANSRENALHERKQLELLIEKQVDGVILIPSSEMGQHFNYARAAGIPVVLVDRLVRDFETDAVLVDNLDATYRAVKQLYAMGRRRFGFIGGNMALTTARERYTGFTYALRDLEVTIGDDEVRFGDFHFQSGFDQMAQLMRLPDPPDTVFIANYFMQLGALRYVIAHRKAVPKTLFLAGFDDMVLTSAAGIPSLMIAQPVEAIGREAARILLERVTGGSDAPPRV